MPKVIILLCAYFKIAVGEFEIMEKILPKVLSNTILNEEEIELKSRYLHKKLQDNHDISTPWLLLEFERGVFYGLVTAIIILPVLLLLSKLTKS